MPDYQIQMIIHTDDNVPENFATNTWACSAQGLPEAILFASEVTEFYRQIDDVFSDLVAQNGHQYKIYDIADPTPRSPLIQGTFDLPGAPTGGAPLPTEVSLCVSFQGEQSSGVPQARRRGRIYVPFIGQQYNVGGRPTAALVSGLRSGGQLLLDDSIANSAQYYWSIYSRVTGEVTPVDNGWVDNEWDTQRRRGRTYTSRSLFTTP